MNIVKLLGALSLAALLAACGGGGGSAGTPVGSTSSSTGTTVPTAASTVPSSTVSSVATPAAVSLSASNFSIPSGSGSSVISALVTDSKNNAIVGAPVSFSADSGVLTNISSVTGQNGIANATLMPAANRSNRNITVTANSGVQGSSVVVVVSGTTLLLSAPATAPVSVPLSVSVKLRDSSGNPIANQSLVVSSSRVNVVASTVTTDSLGNATIAYSAANGGNDVLTVKGAGTSATANIFVSTSQFSAISPVANQNIAVSTSYQVTFQYLNPGPQVGLTVTFSTTQGSLSAVTGVTNGLGQVTVNATSNSAGPAVISAAIAGVGSASVPVNFVAVTPASLILQLAPSYINANSAGSTANQSQASATVRDANNNPVAGQSVQFNLSGQLGGAVLSNNGVATTDSNGNAVVNIVAGTGSTGANQLIVTATVGSVQGTAAMTIGGAALNIKISTDNLVTPLTITSNGATVAYYQKNFLINVTDANGVGVPNQSVSLGVYPIAYGKGQLSYNGSVWSATVTAQVSATLNPGQVVFCANEDPTGSAVITTALDINGNGRLDPGGPIVLTASPVVTNNLGLAVVGVQYGQSQAPWIYYRITGTVNVAGTASTGSANLVSVGATADFSSATQPPAAVTSPYGVNGSCANPN